MQTQSALNHLKTLGAQIHAGMYPSQILYNLGKEGFYRAFLDKGAQGLAEAIDNVAKVAQICGNTGFCVWAHSSLIWYLLNSCNMTEKQKELFNNLSLGVTLGGTGLSNPLKAFVGLDKMRLKAKRTKDGILLNGTLPWVSNLQAGNYFAIIAELESSKTLSAQSCIMALVVCDENLKLKNVAPFCAYEGSGTYSCVFKDYAVSKEFILSDPADKILGKINAGFVALQCGMGVGLCKNALNQIKKPYLQEKRIEILSAKLERIEHKIAHLAKKPYAPNALNSYLRIKSQLIALVNELANLCIMHSGASGYIQGSKASKLLAEGAFFSIVSPSYGHIQKLLG